MREQISFFSQDRIKEMVDKNDLVYQCSLCSQWFVKGWSEQEAIEEAQQYFGCIPKEQMVIVCDACWKKIRPKRDRER